MRSMTTTETDYSDIEIRKKLALRVTDELWQLYPDAECTLDHIYEPWKLLVSGILAAQCTDARVNLITPGLFSRYPTINDLADADTAELEEIIRSCGFYRVKASSITRSMQMLVSDFKGTVPAELDDLLKLPGVGRKIANLVLGDSYGIPGIVVDTHCARVSGRIGFTDSSDPVRIEKDLVSVIPENRWIGYGHRVVAHGRALCKARNPSCDLCSLREYCRKGREEIGAGK